MQAASRFRFLFVVTWLLLAAGCGQMPDRPSSSSADDLDTARAAQLFASGQYLAAADIYRQLAARAPSIGQRVDYLLRAAEASLAGADRNGTNAILEELRSLGLSETQALQARLLQAELLLLERRASDALGVLGPVPPQGTPRDLQIRYHRDMADAYRQMGNLLETANALQAVDALQTDHQARLQTQIEILRTLALLNELALTNLQPSPPGVAGGWMQLALLVKEYGGDPYELQIKFGEWLQRFPQHPALPELLEHYQRQRQSQLQQASRIAVLLPQSGTYANVAAAIRDGIMISRFEMPEGQRPELQFFDSTDPAGIWPLYSQAVTAGAQLVIGPLQKESVAQLMRAGELPVPVLALNQTEIAALPTPNLYMYSLSPEDEARQAAERIWLDDGRRPIILAPQGDWGDRVTNAFEDRWRSFGADVAGIGRYDESSHDYTETITGVLQIDKSMARHQEMQRWLGRNLEFEPSRRDDVDAVFLAARPVQAQGIRPQLQFHHAGDLPIYATSHAWQGALTANQVEDLKGIMLADIPWMIDAGAGDLLDRNTIAEYLPKSRSGYARLYAMGIDALRLVPHLKRLQSSRYESLDGVTGNLYMDETNQIHRQLVWIVLDKEPEVLGYSPRLDLQGQTQPLIPDAPSMTSRQPLP
jgi:hypothetical protein